MTLPKDPFLDPAKVLAAMDFAAKNELREKRHRGEMETVLHAMIEAIDTLRELEQQLDELRAAGASCAPIKSVGVLRKKMLQQLGNANVLPMNAAGSHLDLARHEVVATVQDDGMEENTVLEERRPGYLWNGRLLRRAEVIISKRS